MLPATELEFDFCVVEAEDEYRDSIVAEITKATEFRDEMGLSKAIALLDGIFREG